MTANPNHRIGEERMEKYYMHTINGKPAAFYQRDGQICFMSHYGNRKCNLLVESLGQIRREQKLSRDSRAKRGCADDFFKEGYVIVRLPQQREE